MTLHIEMEVLMNHYVLLSGFSYERGFFETAERALKAVIGETKKLLFIASRMNEYKANDERVEKMTDWFDLIGISFEEVDLIDDRIAIKEQQELIKNAQYIFLMGGDTLAQRDYLREKGLKPLLVNFDGPIIGISAGAINMAVRSVLPFNPTRGCSHVYEGLGLVDISVIPHYDPLRVDYNQTEVMPLSDDGELIALEENGAVLVKDKEVFFYGTAYCIHKRTITRVKERMDELRY